MSSLILSILYGVFNATILTYIPSLAGNTYLHFSDWTSYDLQVSGTISLIFLIIALIFDIYFYNRILKNQTFQTWKILGLIILSWSITVISLYNIIVFMQGHSNTALTHLGISVINAYSLILSTIIVFIYRFIKARVRIKKGEE